MASELQGDPPSTILHPQISPLADGIIPTPLLPVRLDENLPAIWCKLEYLNPSGSTKDRIASFILESAWREGRVQAGDLVIEASSGSTSIAMARMCARLGLRFMAIMPEGTSNERSLIIRAYGGEIRLSPRESGIRGAIAEAERLGREPGAFLPRQFSNPQNAEAHRVGTAPEILSQIPGGRVDAVVSGVGTGGTLVGLFQGLCESGTQQVIPFLARPVHYTRELEVECCSFSPCIPGVADCVSTIFREELLAGLKVIEIEDDLALRTTRELIRRGFPVGPSSGLNYAAALLAAEQLGKPEARIVTVFADRMERYFSTELFHPFAKS